METRVLQCNNWVNRALNCVGELRDAHRALHAPRWSTPAEAHAETHDPRYDWMIGRPLVDTRSRPVETYRGLSPFSVIRCITRRNP